MVVTRTLRSAGGKHGLTEGESRHLGHEKQKNQKKLKRASGEAVDVTAKGDLTDYQEAARQWKTRAAAADDEAALSRRRLADMQALVASSTSLSELHRGLAPFPYPHLWEGDVVHNHPANCLVVRLDEQRHPQEWARVVQRFQESQASHVVSIERIQNRVLWERFCKFQSATSSTPPPASVVATRAGAGAACNPTTDVAPLYLFHGTRANQPKLIYGGTSGFDLNKARSGAWGCGVYAAKDATYSCQGYTHLKSSALQGTTAVNYQQLLIVRCAVGNVRTGDFNLDREPREVDSVCVNQGACYVFRRSEQLYPEYLVTFR